MSTGWDTLRNPFVRAFAFGRAMTMLASQFVSVAVGWELYERTNAAWALGLVGLAQALPAMLLMLPAGNLADRFPRRNLAMLAYGLTGLAALGLAVVSALRAEVAFVFGLLVLNGVARALAAPAAGALLAQVLRPREFATANAWVVSSTQLASISGPAVAGLLIAASGAATWVYLAAAAGQFVFVGALANMPVGRPPRHAAGRGLRDLFAGVVFMRRSGVFLAAITLDLFAVLLGGAVVLLPIFARDVLEIGPAGLGLLRAAPPLGALVAALLAIRLPPWRQPGRVLLLVVAGFGLATIGFGLSRNVYLSLVCLFCVGACDSISMVIRGTLEQALTPERLRGRVVAVYQLFTAMSNELGAFESGATAALFGPIMSVVGGGFGTLVVVAAVALAWPALARVGPLHTLRAVDPDAAMSAHAAGPVRAPRSG